VAASWKGFLTFGMISIPIELSPAARSERISFNQLHAVCHTRLKQPLFCPTCDKFVERSEIEKGYEYEKDQYLLFKQEELDEIEPDSAQAMEILSFVKAAEVDPVYFDGTYYLAPDKGGAKPYALLASALRKAKQCAVGRWVSRGKEHIVVIRPMQDGLAMHQLHFQAQVRSIKDVGLEAATVSEPELKLAEQLINQLGAKRFDPNEYVDEFKARVEAAIEKKVQGKEVSLAEAPAAAQSSNVINLMEALRASINARGSKPAEVQRKAPKRAAAPAARKSARR